VGVGFRVKATDVTSPMAGPRPDQVQKDTKWNGDFLRAASPTTRTYAPQFDSIHNVQTTFPSWTDGSVAQCVVVSERELLWRGSHCQPTRSNSDEEGVPRADVAVQGVPAPVRGVS
jgi:hypothetical protein